MSNLKTIVPGKLVVAVDFDGTITTNPEISSEPLIARPGAIDALRRLNKFGVRFVLWTCRTDEYLEHAMNFLESQGVGYVFEAVNEHIPEILEKWPNPSRKIYADLYVDDKMLGVDNIYGTKMPDIMYDPNSGREWSKIEEYIMNLLKLLY